MVVVEFPSLAQAKAAYHSCEYEQGKKLRKAIGAADFAIVEGVAG